MSPPDISHIITAVGALGTASFGLVDATKALWGGGVNNIGFHHIVTTVTRLTPIPAAAPNAPAAAINALPQADILATLKANWFNGTDLGSQKAIAKSLVKLYLNPANAAAMALKCNLDPIVLTSIATKIAASVPLAQPNPAAAPGGPPPANEVDVYARFDLILTAILDEAYQQADQAYTNGTRAWAVVFSIALSYTAAFILSAQNLSPVHGLYRIAFIVGLLAAPLAPIAKNLSSALATALDTMQAATKK